MQRAFLLFIAWAIALTSHAQNIVGRDHPELIPDSKAYLMVLCAHSHFDSDKKDVSEPLHTAIGLSTSDHVIYDSIMLGFRTEYTGLENAHNDALAGVARGDRNGRLLRQQQFAHDLDDLVTRYVAEIKGQLSPDGALKFASFIQSQKSNIIMGAQQ